MRILLLNWRDPKNPKSGGAEKLNMQILKPLVDRGDSVVWYAQASPGLPSEETYRGITIVRFGNTITHLLVWPLLLWSGKLGKVDFIIDSIHGTGYLSSLFAPKTRKVILICEVAQNIWDEMYAFPINVFGKMWEKVLFRFYPHHTFWTISESTKKDLINFGVNAASITVLPMGFDGLEVATTIKKYEESTALFVGRLAEMKGILDAVHAVESVNNSGKRKWKLHILGRGTTDFEDTLKNYVQVHRLTREVKFFGFVSEQEKFNEMAKAWLLLVPSTREGWGMIVPEANSVGTPALGYDVPGLADVLPKSAPENIVVSRDYLAIKKVLQNMERPLEIKKKPKAGWKELTHFVLEYVS